MRLLHLIPHAQTRLTEGIPAAEWPLTPAGHLQARALAIRLGKVHVSRVVTSPETKAYETGQAIAERLGVPLVRRAGMQEHQRESVTRVNAGADLASMASLFARPSEPVYGDESADTARLRFFSAALSTLMNESGRDELIVSHGTVIILLLAEANGLDAQRFWNEVSLPDYFILEWPSLTPIRHGFERARP